MLFLDSILLGAYPLKDKQTYKFGNVLDISLRDQSIRRVRETPIRDGTLQEFLDEPVKVPQGIEAG